MKISILGCGSIGTRHAKNLLELGYSVNYIFDPIRNNSEILSKKIGGEIIDNQEECILLSDIVFICTPPNTHTELLKFSIDNGKHIFCEKPISNSRNNLVNILKKADKNNLKIVVGYMLKFHPGLKTIKNMIDSGKIGNILGGQVNFGYFLPYWRSNYDYKKNYFGKSSEGGGIILELSHELDYVRWIFGEIKSVTAVSAHISDLEIETDDYAEIILETNKKNIINIHLDCLEQNYRRNCHIIGTKGSIEWDFNGKIKIVTPKNTEEINTNFEINDLYLEELQSFLSQIDSPQINVNNGWEALKTLDLAIAAINSSKSGKKVILD